jgi:tetratricopeptide (TPR) repeat protein
MTVTPRSLLPTLAALAAVAVAACQPTTPVEEAAAQIPVTTSSDEARELFLAGRDLQDRLRGTDANEYFVRALDKDPDFAWAHLAAAFTSATAQDFWNHLDRAVAAANGASDGERLLILASEAGAKGHPDQQLTHLAELIELYPDDPRAHNALAGTYFGRQDYEQAIAAYERAIELDPDFSQPYNQKGYAHRFLGDVAAAEAAFKKYIELIPDDPNPYDSYAELLMKTGRFPESIDNYRLALAQDPHFVASFIGIANNQMFMGDMEAARATLADLEEAARNVGEKRAALFWQIQSHLHEDNYEAALATWQRRYDLAAADNDLATMAGDLNLRGDIQLEAGLYDEASASYAESVEVIEQASVADDVKENVRRNVLFDEARVALARGDAASAAATAAAYGELITAVAIPFEIRQHHELEGMIALAEADYAGAAAHLEQANQQNPRVLYLLAKAHRSLGNNVRARDFCERAANFNALSGVYAFVREPALEMLAEL